MKERLTLRPALAAKFQEYLTHRKEFMEFKKLDHYYLHAAWLGGLQAREGQWLSFDHWRDSFAKEEEEINKRYRSTPPA